jgi:hypothetical protein
MEVVVKNLKGMILSYGGLAKLSKAMGVTKQCINGWIRRDCVPEGKIWPFCEVTGFMPWEVRPDLFSRPEDYWARTLGIQSAHEARSVEEPEATQSES